MKDKDKELKKIDAFLIGSEWRNALKAGYLRTIGTRPRDVRNMLGLTYQQAFTAYQRHLLLMQKEQVYRYYYSKLKIEL